MSLSLHSAFHSLDSVVGREKQALLNQNSVIAAKYSEVEPKYRTSWEDLLKFGKIGSAVFAHAMRKAKDGASPANQLERERDANFVLLFCLEQAQTLAATFQDYCPEYGFDLDLVIVVGSMMDHRAIQVYCEVFPRSEDGRMVTAFGSSISRRSTLKVSEEEMGGPETVVAPIMGLLLGEGGARGEDVSDAARRITHWYRRTKGIWPVTGDFLTNFFLNRALSSVVVSEGEIVRSASVHRDFNDNLSEAGMGTMRLV